MRLHNTTNPYKIDQKEIAENFLEWWWPRRFAASDKDPDNQMHTIGEVHKDDYKRLLSTIQVMTDGTINMSGNVELHDDRCTVLPFKFGNVGNFKIYMPNLRSLDRFPTETKQFGIEAYSSDKMNKHITSMMGCPRKATHMTFELAHPLENLQTSLAEPIESIWIQAPAVKSFAGLNIHVLELTLNLSQQMSISGIHKQLRNVEELMLVLPANFEGGLMALPMIPGLRAVGSGGTVSQAARAINTIGKLMREGRNVHDIQEFLIESGQAKFARL